MTHELVDQLSRHQSGGQIIDYWKQNPMPAEEFVLARMGAEARDVVDMLRSSAPATRQLAVMKADSVGRFRLGGEVHQWMYDRLSLARLLTVAGFDDVRVCSAIESSIAGFADYQLDADNSGSVRKPDSLFMEARKPSESA